MFSAQRGPIVKPRNVFVCPKCDNVSGDIKSIIEGYCENCEDWTGREDHHITEMAARSRRARLNTKYICRDCDGEVFAFGISEPPNHMRCVTCEIVAQTEDPQEKAGLRRYFNSL